MFYFVKLRIGLS